MVEEADWLMVARKQHVSGFLIPSIGWCGSHAGRVFHSYLTLSGNPLTDTPNGVFFINLGFSKSNKVDLKIKYHNNHA